ncbi:SdrD B-like domain-containing protein [Taibaiella koreensis]|uniref:SdrD B-like domain-containing protein n=1 Tax=Taibaiella koreensis TaxID=1268548 RepID=UPI000E59A976|nr:SdrD B-like domain-containing protein [Taibaiella koreensis]
MKSKYLPLKAFVLAALFHAGMTMEVTAQTCYTSNGCSDYSNFGYNSDSANTLEYDNYVSAFHSTVVRDLDGSLKIWGERTKANGTGSWLVPATINAGNYPGLTGTPLKVAMGSGGTDNVQFVLLTSDNKLWVWGVEGNLVHDNLTSGTSFQQLGLGLPAGVIAAEVKMLYGTSCGLILTTCGGHVYVLTNYQPSLRGDGVTSTAVSSFTTWSHVEKQGGGYLTGIVAARGTLSGAFALDNSGNLWTWGLSWNGVSASSATRSRAVSVPLPAGATGPIKMIGMTHTSSNYDNSYYVLYKNGNLYAMGYNNLGQLGNWNTTNQPTWVQPHYTSASGPVMNDIKWISPNEHDQSYAAINVLTNGKIIYNWGEESGNMIGRGSNNSGPSAVNPGQPSGFQAGFSNTNIVAVESGGHTTMILRECASTFGYVGHRVDGSMGDNASASAYDPIYHFNTNAVQVCGAPTSTAGLDASLNGPCYTGGAIQLIGTPAGGTYAIDNAGSTASASLSGTTLTFNTTGTLRVNYTVNTGGSCGTATAVKVFNVLSAVGSSNIPVTIPGTIWNDTDGDAVKDAGENGIVNGLWVNLVAPNGTVIASTEIKTDGTYAFLVGTSYLAASGNYSVIVTNDAKVEGDPLATADTLNGGYIYTGVNRGTTGIDATNRTGKLNVGNLSTVTGGTTTNPVNFGIRPLSPVANNDTLSSQARGTSAIVPNILGNDVDSAGNMLMADSITLIIPAGMPTGTLASATDAQGDITEITVPGEGVWTLNPNGTVTFVPEAAFFDDPTPVQYIVTSQTGTTSNAASINIDYNDVVNVSGVIYHDANGIIGGANGTPAAGITVTLYDTDGLTVIATAVTAANGSYSFAGVNPDNYIVSVTPPAGYVNVSSTDATPLNGSTSVNASGTNDIQNINFGIEQPPVADEKDYLIDQSAFSGAPPSGFPNVSTPGDNWYAIPMSSPELTGATGGAMSGTDAEDCTALSSCNTGTGTTFSIQTINSNTKVFYDFGGTTGIVAIDVTSGPVAIANFDLTKLVIWGQEGSGTSGNEIGFTYAITDKAGVSSTPVSYAIGTGTPLPVTLLSFNAKRQGSAALLSWTTASEVNNRGFAIERSKDATGGWINIGFVESLAPGGNSSAPLEYNFVDSKPLSNNFYRLKQTDLDGRYVYSLVRQISFGLDKQITISPNPASNYITVGGLSGMETIKVYDVTGRLIRKEKAAGSTVAITLDGLPRGTYHVAIISGDEKIVSEKVMKL